MLTILKTATIKSVNSMRAHQNPGTDQNQEQIVDGVQIHQNQLKSIEHAKLAFEIKIIDTRQIHQLRYTAMYLTNIVNIHSENR